MLDIYVCKIDIESIEKVALIKKLRELVSIDRKQKIDDYILDDDKLRSAMAEIMIKKVLMDEYGFRKSNIAFKYSKYGKPYLVGCDRIYFNVSHSGKWIVCAFADKEVGIDIQNTDTLIGEFQLSYDDAKRYTSRLKGSCKVKRAHFAKPIHVKMFANI